MFRSRIAANLGGKMKACRLFPFLVVALLGASCLSAEQTQKRIQPQKQDNSVTEVARLKLIKSPIIPYPEEAQKKNIEGKVLLGISVDAQGRVSEAKALSGPSELVQSAIESVKRWEFEPPTHAPVVATVEVIYGHPKECPGSISESGEVLSPGVLKGRRITLELEDAVGQWSPPYFAEDRKSGIAGEMVLSITVDAEGKITNVHVVKSLSPHLDNAAAETVRNWKFKLKAVNLDSLPDDFPVRFFFRPMCRMSASISH